MAVQQQRILEIMAVVVAVGLERLVLMAHRLLVVMVVMEQRHQLAAHQ